MAEHAKVRDVTAADLKVGMRTGWGEVAEVRPPDGPGLPMTVTFRGQTPTAFWPDMPIRVLGTRRGPKPATRPKAGAS